MIIAIDFDRTIVKGGNGKDLTTPLEFLPGAKAGLESLKRAGHIIVIYSTRANRALTENWNFNPLWRLGLVPFDEAKWKRNRRFRVDRYVQMLRFLKDHMSGLYDAWDDGLQGKIDADLFIDDKTIGGVDWAKIAELYGEPPAAPAPENSSS